jgi:uncharacterized membrane protein YoaK (UPF0700 family)
MVLAAFLTWIAGFVDAVGYLSLDKIYTANMSGNSVAIGMNIAAQNWVEAARRVTPVAAYVIGLLFCRLLVLFSGRNKFRSVASLAFLCEMGLLIPVAVIATPHPGKQLGFPLLLIALLALGMGIQNAALTHFSTMTVHTGFVTGTLVKSMEQLAAYVACLWDRVREPGGHLALKLRQSFGWKEFRLSAWLMMIWGAYVIGALCGAYGKFAFSTRALFLPLGGILAVIGIDLKHPLAFQDEEEQQKI